MHWSVRIRRWVSLIGVIALVGNLWLPVAHASAMARSSHNPLAYAFCGTASAAGLRLLQATAPAELIAKLQERGAAKSALQAVAGCQLCLAAVQPPMVAPAAGLAPLAPAVPVYDAPARAPPAVRSDRRLLPPLRAPPSIV